MTNTVIDILIAWYALGWASVGIWCIRFDTMSWGEFIITLLGGPPAFMGYGLSIIIEKLPNVWRRK